MSSDGSGYVRIHLSNAHTNSPVTFDEATIAAQASAGGPATVDLVRRFHELQEGEEAEGSASLQG